LIDEGMDVRCFENKTVLSSETNLLPNLWIIAQTL